MLGCIIENRKCVFIGAHYDDIEIGCLGILQKYCTRKEKNYKNLSFYILGTDMTEDNIHEETSENILKKFSSNIIKYDSNTLVFDYKKTKEIISYILQNENPEYIFFHSGIETHNDHKMIHNVVKEIARPLYDNKLKGLVEFYIPNNAQVNLEYFNWFEKYSHDFNLKQIELKNFKYLKREDRRGIQYIEKVNELASMYSGVKGVSEVFKITKFRN